MKESNKQNSKQQTLADIIEERINELLKENKLDKNNPSSIKEIILQNITKNSTKESSVEAKDKKKEETIISGQKEKPEEDIQSGYGTTGSSAYGGGGTSPYTSYQRLFSYLGSFRAKGAYDDIGLSNSEIESAMQGEKFFMIDKEVMESSVRAIKYKPGGVANDNTLVPMGNVSSSDWELFKIWKMIDPVMYNLKLKTV